MKWVGGKYGEFGGEIERTYKRECQVTVREQRRVFFSENAHNSSVYVQISPQLECSEVLSEKSSILRQTVNFSSSWAESESDSESFEAGGQMSESA